MKTALIYSHSASKTKQVAQHIKKAWGDDLTELNVEEIHGSDLIEFDNLIIGVSTWFDGELPRYWDEMVPELEQLDFSKKKVALFGLGDQVGYPENFLDAVGLLGDVLVELGASRCGFTSTEGYTYERSVAERGDQFCGLAIDIENQSGLTLERVKNWVKQLKKEF